MQFRHADILGKGFAQALMHTVNSTSAKGFSKIVLMAKLDIFL